MVKQSCQAGTVSCTSNPLQHGQSASALETECPLSCNEDVKPFHDILLKENIVFLEVLKNLDKLEKNVFFMSYAPLPIIGLDSCPVRAYAIEGLEKFSK